MHLVDKFFCVPGTPMKTQSGQTVIVQNSASGQRPMMMQQANTGQFMLTSGLQGQMQLVASTHQPGQYVLQTGGPQGTYVVAQPQTAVVHGQPQTVLVAQTAQQQGSPAKTIIILQQQPPPSQATHHQKVCILKIMWKQFIYWEEMEASCHSENLYSLKTLEQLKYHLINQQLFGFFTKLMRPDRSIAKIESVTTKMK